jgi:hypothetical protein
MAGNKTVNKIHSCAHTVKKYVDNVSLTMEPMSNFSLVSRQKYCQLTKKIKLVAALPACDVADFLDPRASNKSLLDCSNSL